MGEEKPRKIEFEAEKADNIELEDTSKEECSDKEGNATEDSDDDIDLGDWDYEIVDLEEAMKYASQACFNIRGVSYTPPGWKRVYKRRKCPKRASCAKIKLED